MKKIYIESNGCAVLRHETQRYAIFFRENGWQEVADPKKADIILMTCCGVVNWTEDKAIEALSRLIKEARPDAQIIAGGCLPKINPERIKKLKKDIVMFGPKNAGILDNIIGAHKSIKDVVYNCDPLRSHSVGDPTIVRDQDEIDQREIISFLDRQFKTERFQEIYDYLTSGRHFWKEEKVFEVKVTSGCVNNCSYCATKLAIGDLQSEDSQKIADQVEAGVKAGYKKILFIGDEVGYYGIDHKTDLVELMKKLDGLDKLKKDFRIALRYVDPIILIEKYDQLKKYFKNGRIYYFCAALQSGNPRILRLMNRKNYVDKFVDVLNDLDKNFPTAFKHTQVIVGFPGETETEFNETIEVLKKCNFDYITITAYKDRPGTKSCLLGDHVTEDEISRRFEKATLYGKENRNKQFWKRIQREIILQVKNGKKTKK